MSLQRVAVVLTSLEWMPRVIQIQTNMLMNQWRIRAVVNG